MPVKLMDDFTQERYRAAVEALTHVLLLDAPDGGRGSHVKASDVGRLRHEEIMATKEVGLHHLMCRQPKMMHQVPTALQFHAESGDGQPVLLIPGFLFRESSLQLMQDFLLSKGFKVELWQEGQNIGPQDKKSFDALLKRVETHIKKMYAAHGRRVTIVGHSLGGVYALKLAERCPQYIEQVVGLGSPYVLDGHEGDINSFAVHLLEKRNQSDLEGIQNLLRVSSVPQDVGWTAIHSHHDQVVGDVVSRIPDNMATIGKKSVAVRENIDVNSSHVGMAVAPSVMLAICHAIAQGSFRKESYSFNIYNSLMSGMNMKEWLDAPYAFSR